MAGEALDQFLIFIGLDGKDIDKDLAKIENKLVSGMSTIATNIVAPLAAMFTLGSMGQMFGNITDEMDALDEAAGRMGVAVDSLHAWQEATKLAGGSADGLNSSVATLSKNLNMIAVNGTGRAAPFLDKLGIKALDASGKARDAFVILDEISEKIEGMDKQESLGMLQALGLDQGTIMLMQSGSKNIKELIKQQKEIGVYTKEDAEIAAEYKDSLDILSRTIKMAVLPIVKIFAVGLTYAATKGGEGIRFLKEHIHLVTPVLAGLALMILMKVIPALIAMGTEFVATSAKFLLSPWGLVLMALIAIGLAIDDLIVWMEGGESAFGDFWASLFGSPEEAKKLFLDIKDAVMEFVDDSLPLLISWGEYLKNIFRTVVAAGKTIIDWILFLGSVLDVLASVIFGIGDESDVAIAKMLGRWGNFKDSMMGYIDSVKNLLGSLYDMFGKGSELVSKYGGKLFGGGKTELAINNNGNGKGKGDDNRHIDSTLNQNIVINTTAGPDGIGNAVLGASKTGFGDITDPINGGDR